MKLDFRRHVDVDIIATETGYEILISEPETGDSVVKNFGLDGHTKDGVDIKDYAGEEILSWAINARENFEEAANE